MKSLNQPRANARARLTVGAETPSAAAVLSTWMRRMAAAAATKKWARFYHCSSRWPKSFKSASCTSAVACSL